MTLIKTFGSSMAPFFKDGDVLEIKKTLFSSLKVNDFVTFKKSGRYITHRVIYKSAKGFIITKGDQNIKSDGKIYPRQMLGKVVQVKRGSKSFETEHLYLIQSSLYFQEIVKIKIALERQNLDFVILKGLPIHLYFEKTHPQRVYADCDLLINRGDLTKLEKILKNFGFKSSSKSLSIINNKQDQAEISYQKDINSFPIIFDVHFQAVFLMIQINNLDSLYPQQLLEQLSNQLLKNKQLIKIQGQQFPILSTENLTVYLALHLFHHNFRGYYRYQLLDQIIKKRRVNFAKLSQIIISYRLQNFVYPVFLLLKKYYQVNISAQFFKNITPSKKIQSFIKKRILKIDIFEDEGRIKSGTDRFKYLFYLSPNPLIKKWQIIFNPQVLYSIYWVLKRRLMIGK